jgi:hypothetical protein
LSTCSAIPAEFSTNTHFIAPPILHTTFCAYSLLICPLFLIGPPFFTDALPGTGNLIAICVSYIFVTNDSVIMVNRYIAWSWKTDVEWVASMKNMKSVVRDPNLYNIQLVKKVEDDQVHFLDQSQPSGAERVALCKDRGRAGCVQSQDVWHKLFMLQS